MSRHRNDPLRPLTADERIALTRLSRSPSAPAAQVERARALLAIAGGASYTAAAHQVGRHHNETISAWVSVDSTWRCPAFVAHQMSALMLMPCGRGGRAKFVHAVHRLAAKRTYAAVWAGLI